MRAKGLVFVDTNILVYAFARDDERRGERARQVVQDLLAAERLCVSTQVLQEFLVTMTRKLAEPWSIDDALAAVDDLAAWRTVLVDLRAIREAALLGRDARLSFWDALIVVAAQRAGTRWLLTEDLSDGQVIAGVEILNPFKRGLPS